MRSVRPLNFLSDCSCGMSHDDKSMTHTRFLFAGIALGAVAATVGIGVPAGIRAQLASWPGLTWMAPANTTEQVKPGHDEHPPADHDDDAVIKLSEAQITAAGIEIASVGEGVLVRRLFVPGAIVPSGDRIARVAVKLLGTVAELRKRLGESVEKGEVVAVIESREVADAKSEYLAARLTHELQQILVGRAKPLMQSKAMAENEYLRTSTAAENARVRLTAARQKLAALGLTDQQIAELPDVAVELLRRQDLIAPISGRIAERRVDLGALVGREGQESELFVIVNLDVVWVELAVPPADLVSIREGQDITVIIGANRERAQAKITFISPLLDKDTRTARVVATLENPSHVWRPGTFVTAEIPFEEQRAEIVVPKAALQTVKGEQVVFVRRDEGFMARKVTVGREDDRTIEILSGLSQGERIAVSNTFILKAELGKAEAAHDH